MGTLPEVDLDGGLGIWGSSFAGGNPGNGCRRERHPCPVDIVAQISNVSGHRNYLQMFSVSQLTSFESAWQ